MNARDRWLINLGFDAGWGAHEAFVETDPDRSEPGPDDPIEAITWT